MELKINIDESRFKDVLEKELAAFSHEELHELIRECIATALRDNETLKALFVQPSRYAYGSTKEPTQIVQQATASIDLSPAYNEIRESMIAELKHNHRELLERVMMRSIIAGLSDDWRFRSSIEDAVEHVLARRQNQTN